MNNFRTASYKHVNKRNSSLTEYYWKTMFYGSKGGPYKGFLKKTTPLLDTLLMKVLIFHDGISAIVMERYWILLRLDARFRLPFFRYI